MVASGKYLNRVRQPRATSLVGDVRGRRAPDFELTSLDGKRVKLSDFRGKAVLLNFWATWCSPCKVEMPWFVDLQKKYGNDGLVVVGVAMDDTDTPKIAEFASEMGVNYPVLLGHRQGFRRLWKRAVSPDQFLHRPRWEVRGQGRWFARP